MERQENVEKICGKTVVYMERYKTGVWNVGVTWGHGSPFSPVETPVDETKWVRRRFKADGTTREGKSISETRWSILNRTFCEFQFWQFRHSSCHVFIRILGVSRLHLIDPSSIEHNSACIKDDVGDQSLTGRLFVETIIVFCRILLRWAAI